MFTVTTEIVLCFQQQPGYEKTFKSCNMDTRNLFAWYVIICLRACISGKSHVTTIVYHFHCHGNTVSWMPQINVIVKCEVISESAYCTIGKELGIACTHYDNTLWVVNFSPVILLHKRLCNTQNTILIIFSVLFYWDIKPVSCCYIIYIYMVT